MMLSDLVNGHRPHIDADLDGLIVLPTNLDHVFSCLREITPMLGRDDVPRLVGPIFTDGLSWRS